MATVFYFQWEVDLILWLQNTLSSDVLVAIGSFLTLFGAEMLAVFAGFIYWCLDKEFGKYVGLNVAMAAVWNPMIKNVFLRKRPYFIEDTEIQCLKAVEKNADIWDISAQGYSFPSGHSMSSAATYGSIAFHSKKKWLWIPAALAIILVGFSRFYLGVHFPTDVFVGWCFGFIILFFVSFLQKKIKNKLVLYGILVLTALPGIFYCTSDDYFTAMGLLIGICLGFLFEEKYVNFSNTKKPIIMAIRLIGGGIIYGGVNYLLKLPFNIVAPDFLSSGTLAAHLVRMGRYTIVIFLLIAIYPMVFKFYDAIFDEEAKKNG